MLVRARGRDLPALALVAARAMARRPFGAVIGWPLAVLGWPVWLMLLILLSRHLWRLERHAVIAIHAPDASRFPAWHQLGAPLVIGTAMGVSLVLWPPAFWLGVGSVATFLVVHAGLYPGRLVAGSRVTHARPPLRISLAASLHRGSGLLHRARVHVTVRYPGLPMELDARDRDLVALYSRMLPIRQVTPGRGRMVGTVPSGPESRTSTT